MQGDLSSSLHLLEVQSARSLRALQPFFHLSHLLPMPLSLAHVSREELRPALFDGEAAVVSLVDCPGNFPNLFCVERSRTSFTISLIEYHTSHHGDLCWCDTGACLPTLSSLQKINSSVLLKELSNKVAVIGAQIGCRTRCWWRRFSEPRVDAWWIRWSWRRRILSRISSPFLPFT